MEKEAIPSAPLKLFSTSALPRIQGRVQNARLVAELERWHSGRTLPTAKSCRASQAAPARSCRGPSLRPSARLLSLIPLILGFYVFGKLGSFFSCSSTSLATGL